MPTSPIDQYVKVSQMGMHDGEGISEIADDMAEFREHLDSCHCDCENNKEDWRKYAEALSSDHWKWAGGLLDSANVGAPWDYEDVQRLAAYLYTTAMFHGFEHGVEYMEAQRDREKRD